MRLIQFDKYLSAALFSLASFQTILCFCAGVFVAWSAKTEVWLAEL
jgi:hypothetical protein